jgi:GNAT superfamily N-acetyltransferase
MESINIRPAVIEDLATLLQFEQGVIAAERPFDPTMKTGNIHYYDLPAMIEATDIQLLVAEGNGPLIACGYARIESAKHFLKHPLHAYLGFMYVVPELRGKGINALIIDALRHWANAKNITELRLDVYYSNTAAIRAYEKQGFMQHLIQMRSPVQ